MNFLIFRDFFNFFLNFYKFKIDFFEINSLKKILSCAGVAGDVARAEKAVPCGSI